MTKEDIVRWLNNETSCYAQDNGNNAILVDGILYPVDICKLAEMIKEVMGWN